MKNNKKIKMDVVRVLLACLVVAIHSIKIEDSLTFYMVNGIARIAVPLFFMLTGMQLQAEKLTQPVYIRKYIKKQVGIFAPWFILYACITIYTFIKTQNIVYGGSLFIQFWFVLATWVALIALHLLLRRFQLGQVLQIAFVLHLLGILGDGYLSIIEQIPLLATIYSFYLSIAMKTRSGLLFGLFYIVLGMYLKDKQVWTKLSNKVIILAIGMSLGVQYVEISMLHRSGAKHYNMYFSLIPLTLLIMCYLKKNECRKKSRINYKKISVTIYITHTLVIFLVSCYRGSFFIDTVFLPVMFIYIGFYIIVMIGKVCVNKIAIFKKDNEIN